MRPIFPPKKGIKNKAMTPVRISKMIGFILGQETSCGLRSGDTSSRSIECIAGFAPLPIRPSGERAFYKRFLEKSMAETDAKPPD
jgi:hypothetical protein